MTNNSFNRIICNRIKPLRIHSGLTIEQLAYESGISKGGLSEIERNMKEPRLYTIAKLCVSLNIPLNKFFDFPEINEFTEFL